jgi:hypothetical protein
MKNWNARWRGTILSLDEAVGVVREKIRGRDGDNERIVEEYGGELPEWTARD